MAVEILWFDNRCSPAYHSSRRQVLALVDQADCPLEASGARPAARRAPGRDWRWL